jgi:hypothetical protein
MGEESFYNGIWITTNRAFGAICCFKNVDKEVEVFSMNIRTMRFVFEEKKTNRVL